MAAAVNQNVLRQMPVTHFLQTGCVIAVAVAAIASAAYCFAAASNYFHLSLSSLFGLQIVELNAYILFLTCPVIIKVSLVAAAALGILSILARAIEYSCRV